jgi:PAS domain S-box-containing protein
MKKEKKVKLKAVKADKVKRRIRLSLQWKMVLAGLAVVAAFMGLFFGYILPNLQNFLVSKGLDVGEAIAAKRNEYIIICGVLAVICFLFVFFFSRTVARNIKKAAQAANKLATGDVDQKLQIKSRDETGELGEALGKVLAYLQKMSDASERIADGDLEIIIKPQSEKDTLNQNFSRIKTNIRTSLEGMQRLEDYLNKIPMSIMVIDKEQKIQFINTACAGTILKKPQDCVGQKCNSLFHTDDCSSGNCASMTAMKQEKACTMETIAHGRKGEHPIRYAGAPIKDNKGNVVGCIEYVMDASKEKMAVDRMTAVANELLKASEELTSSSEQSGSATEQIASVSQQIAKGSEEQTKRIGGVRNALDELSQSIDMVAAGSNQQTSAVEQAADIVKQVSGAAEQTAANAQEAANGATKAAEVARVGSDTVTKTIEGIAKIHNSMQEVSATITELGKHSEEIGNVIEVIDEIAAQTNLLALNAAIEAARAGDQGRGFAVVADEVKKLSERTAKETKDIAMLVGSVQKGVVKSIQASTEGAKQAEEGTKLANEAGAALSNIMDAVNNMVSQIEQISAAAEEMSASANEMVKVIDGVSSVAERNSIIAKQMTTSKTQVSDSTNMVAATIEENSAAAQQMSASTEQMSAQVQQVVSASKVASKMAQELKQAVAIFRIKDDMVARKAET